MADIKTENYAELTVEEMVKKLAEKRTEILENFSKAYLAETGLMPSEVELCCQQFPISKDYVIEHVYFFRKKQ